MKVGGGGGGGVDHINTIESLQYIVSAWWQRHKEM